MGRRASIKQAVDFSEVVGNCAESVLVHDVKGKIVYANDSAAEAFHAHSPESMYGTDILDLLVESEQDKYSARIKMLLESGQSFADIEFSMMTQNGESFIASICAFCIGGEKESRVAIVLHDITARKLVEQGLKRQLEIAHSEITDLVKRKQEDNRIDGRLVHRLVVVYGSYVMKVALKELVEDPRIDSQFISYEEEYEANLVEKLNPDVVVFAFSGCGSMEAEDIRALAQAQKRLHVLVVCMRLDEERAQELIRAGVHGLIAKEDEIRLVPVAINSIVQGELWCSRTVLRAVIDNYRVFSPSQDGDNGNGSILTEREKEILKLIAQSYRNKEIAEKLGISYYTVVTHIYNIYRKLDVNRRVDAIHYAISNGLVGY